MSINLYFCNPVRLKEPVIVKVMTTKTQQIRIEDFDYPLPDERIAKFPLPKRDESKLLLYKEEKSARVYSSILRIICRRVL